MDNIPNPSIGNLTPNQLRKLQHAIWGDPTCPVKFNKNLSLNEVNSSIFFRNTRLFLKTLLEYKNEITATAKGNLSRAFVKVIFEKLELDEKERIFIKQYNKVLNETDAGPLHVIKVVCEVGGIIKKRSKRFFVVKKYIDLLSDEKAGELYYQLFYAYFKKFNLGYCDGYPKFESMQRTLNYTLYRLSQVCENYQPIEKLYREILLPKVREEIGQTRSTTGERNWLLEIRIIRHLVKFGLLEVIMKKEKYLSRIEKVKKSELFGRFVVYDL